MGMLYTGIFAVLVGSTSARVPATLREDGYCALNTGHTMCKYQGPSDDCAAETISRVFTDVGKDSILDALNEMRKEPTAANMKKIVSHHPGTPRLSFVFSVLRPGLMNWL